MSKLLKLYERVCKNPNDVRFSDFTTLIKAFGFSRLRTTGSHRIYQVTGTKAFLNVQSDKGKAKPYQVKQFLKAVNLYQLKLRDRDEDKVQ